MSKEKVLYILFFILQPNIASTLGLKDKTVLYILFLLSLFVLLVKKNKPKISVAFGIFLLIMMVYRYKAGILSESVQSAMIMILPAMMVFPILNEDCFDEKKRKVFQSLIVCFGIYYFAEVIFSIIEFIGHFSILHYQNDTYGMSETVRNRATALSGASLTNALVMSGIMMFILNSPLKQNIKYPLWLGGFISLLCFQGRIAILGSTLYFGYHLITSINGNAKRNIFLASMVLICMGVIALCVYLGFGDRFFTHSVLERDGSTDVRLRMYMFVSSLDVKDYLFGISMSELRFLMVKMQVLIIECFAIIHLLLFGIVFTVVCYALYGRLFAIAFKNYALKVKISIIVGYLLLALINNSFASGFVGLTFFLISAKVFSPPVFNIVVPKKYLEKIS